MTEETNIPIEQPEQIPIEESEVISDQPDRREEQRKRRSRRAMKMSIILGVRDRAQYVKKVIRSLLVQDLQRYFYEIVIVDFGSQDDLKEYIDLIKVKNLKYVAVPDAKQYDRARALNIGAKAAEHHILVFSEADLLFPKYALRVIKEHLIEHDKQIMLIRQKDLMKLETAIIIGKTYSDYGEMLSKIDLNTRPSRDGCIVIERNHFDAVGGFDESYVGESYEVLDFVERVERDGLTKIVLENANLLHMWHNELTKENEGYFWELYNRQGSTASSVRNVNREWGVLVPKRRKVLFLMSPKAWEPGSICKHVGEFLYSSYQIDMCGARDDLRKKTTRKYDMIFTIDWQLPKQIPDNCRFAAGVFDYTSWNEGILHNVPPESMGKRLELFDAIATPCKELRDIVFSVHPNTFYTPIGVDTEAFKPLQYKRRVSNNFTCGWVGKPENEHTMEGYLEHVKPICNSVAGIDLFSAPGGEDINGPTQMLGFYNAIDVLVMFNESMGDTKCILEAMACGLPVITTRVGDVQEIIENNVNGIVISRNEAELLEALLTLKEKPEYRLKMGQLARETAVRQWDWRDVAHHWKIFFDRVMEQ